MKQVGFEAVFECWQGGGSLSEIGRELYRVGAANSNDLPLFLLVRIQGMVRSSESEDLSDLVVM